MPFSIHGLGVSAGIAIGRAHLMSHASLEVSHYDISEADVDNEVGRFQRAVEVVRGELEGLTLDLKDTSELGAFVHVHLMLLNDSNLSELPKERIRSERCNAEWALRKQADEVFAHFDEVEDAYIRERRDDVRQVVERVMAALTGLEGLKPKLLTRADEQIILVARDLSPADVIIFKEHKFAGFVTDLGGATSHTAIMARSLNIPSMVAAHNARGLIREDEIIIIDGYQGVLIADPSETVLAEYRLKQSQIVIERQKLQRIKFAPATTIDGAHIELHANVELPSDLEEVTAAGATGVGLFRSEFLFLNRDTLPNEEEQFEAYRAVVEGMEGLPVTIRTLDIGADKELKGQQSVAINPALGLRAIRYCLAEPQMFNTQLRALLRASAYGKLEILIPMISNLAEVDGALAAIKRAREELQAEGVKVDPNIPIGGMIEIPAAAIVLPMFLEKLDFISVGTNDLIQYTLAIDRADDEVAHLYNPLHPAIIYLLSEILRVAKRANKPVAVCGEMAGDIRYTRLLLGLGLRNFSMHPAHLLEVKQRVLTTNLPDMSSVINKLLKATEPDKIRSLIDKLNA
jgi:phosphoenolpyruvate-protein phosphotransferase (PTS system enzyme I)